MRQKQLKDDQLQRLKDDKDELDRIKKGQPPIPKNNKEISFNLADKIMNLDNQVTVGLKFNRDLRNTFSAFDLKFEGVKSE